MLEKGMKGTARIKSLARPLRDFETRKGKEKERLQNTPKRQQSAQK